MQALSCRVLLRPSAVDRRAVCEKMESFVRRCGVTQVLSLLAIILFALTSAAESQTVVFENVNVIPMDRERVIERQTVVVRDGRIAQMGPAASVRAPAEATRVDG